MLKTYRPLIISTVVCSCVLAFYGLGLRILINKSGSLPGYVYVYKLGTSAAKGELIAFKHHEFPVVLIKKVMGGAGDVVSVDGCNLMVNHKNVASLQNATSTGKVCKPISPQTIPEEHWFVLGEHPKSYDSRYRSFGLVHAKDVLGQAWRVF